MDFHVEYREDQQVENLEAFKTLLDFDSGDLPFRERIMELQSVMLELPEMEIPIEHLLSGGMYSRTMFAKAGTLLIGKIYKKDQIVILSSGIHEFRSETMGGVVEGPCMFKSPAGTKRVGYCHTDVVWTCIVKTDATTIEEAEKDIYADSYEELDRFMLGDTLESAGG